MIDEPEVYLERAKKAARSASRNRVASVLATVMGTYFVVYGVLSLINFPSVAWALLVVSGLLMGAAGFAFYWSSRNWEEAEFINIKMYSLSAQSRSLREWFRQ